MGVRTALALLSCALGLLVVSIATWYLLIYIDIWDYDPSTGYQFFFAGIGGIVLVAISVAALYRIEKQRKASTWRLAEKIAALVALVFMGIDLVFSGYRGTNEGVVRPATSVMVLVADILVIAVVLSYTERTRRVE